MEKATDLERGLALLTLEYNLLTPPQALRIIENSRKDSKDLIELLGEMLPQNVILKSLSKAIGVSYIDLDSSTNELEVNSDILDRADKTMLEGYNAIPMVDSAGRIIVVVSNPKNQTMIDYLRKVYNEGFKIAMASQYQILNKLAYYSSMDVEIPVNLNANYNTSTNEIRDYISNKSPMETWVNNILSRAVSESASDVHFMFDGNKNLILRFRVDGILKPIPVQSGINGTEAVSSIMSRCSTTMDPTNNITPQDGTFSFMAARRQVDARVATLPQANGTTCVIRLLDSANMRIRLDDMGFSPAHLRTIRENMTSSQGTIIAVGPTGSGKTTSLYAILREVNAVEKNVLTVEDPIEYRIPNIGQTEIRAGLGDRSLTFARALRSILRLDPDVILVGEIRDKETSEVAMQAAITGHLVLTSLHANSAIASFSRLTNMGLAPYIASEAITLVISQRLLRKLHECKIIDEPTPHEASILASLGFPIPEKIARPGKCMQCNNTGYKGRVAAVEVLSPSRELKNLVAKSSTADVLEKQARADGYYNILEDGYRHVKEFRTSADELIRILAMEVKDE